MCGLTQNFEVQNFEDITWTDGNLREARAGTCISDGKSNDDRELNVCLSKLGLGTLPVLGVASPKGNLGIYEALHHAPLYVLK